MLDLIAVLLITYWTSRLLYRVVPLPRAQFVTILLVHLVSLGAIIVVIGLFKAWGNNFNIRSAPVYIVPQIVWLVFDLFVRPARNTVRLLPRT